MLAVSFTPAGSPYFAEESAAGPPHERALVEAFRESAGDGLVQLVGAQLSASLPASVAWLREVGHAVMAALCALPDLEERRQDFELALGWAELAALLERLPPVAGAEYVTRESVAQLAAELVSAVRTQLGRHEGSVQDWLQALNPLWNTIGRVHLNLAERKDDAARPFAFLATYTARLGAGARAQHVPLGSALQEYAGEKNRGALLSLLRPIQRGAAAAPFLAELVESGKIYQPLAWKPAEALRFLREVPAYEAAGIIARIPDWWKPRQPPRPQVRVTVGAAAASGVGLDALLDFQVDVALNGQTLTAAERKELLRSAGGLVKLRGQWVDVDAARLDEVLKHWTTAQAAHRGGLSFLEAMRLLAGVEGAADASGKADPAGAPSWVEKVAGPWLDSALSALRDPAAADGMPRAGAVQASLRPYQHAGVSWLYQLGRLGLGGCLADDMGLGKTLQVLALMARLKQDGKRPPHLVVVPASLMANWEAEAQRFTPGLELLVAHPSAADRPRLSPEVAGRYDAVVTSYGYLSRLPWASTMKWDLVVLDEAQAIKNAGTAQARLVKSLSCRARLALTGTPVENRLGDLWSLFDFLNPGLLGSAKTFGARTKNLEASADGFAPLRRLVRPYILRRLKSDRTIVNDLPDKTEVTAFCHLTRTQAALYQESVAELAATLEDVEGMRRRGLVLAFLTRFKQICNHPSQWSGDGRYRPEDSAKFARLTELAEPLAQRQEKVLVFTQYREMTAPLASHLAGIFGRPGLVLHGGTPVKERKNVVARFQEDPAAGFLVLSLKAGGTGLNLTAATHVIHFDRWWNPAVEDQATDRAYRIGQHKSVMVHKFTCRGTIEERIELMLASKRALSRGVLTGEAEVALTELSDRELLDMVRLDIDRALAET